MLPIVPQKKFMEQRRLYYTQHILQYAYSLSLEYAIFAVVCDLVDPAKAEELASKASILLDMEIRGMLTTLGSIQASVLLGWRECGSPKAGHYSAIAVQLAVDFGIHIDPSEYVSATVMSRDEEEVRRLICWGVFVFDR
jgi:hypothetical protein